MLLSHAEWCKVPQWSFPDALVHSDRRKREAVCTQTTLTAEHLHKLLIELHKTYMSNYIKQTIPDSNAVRCVCNRDSADKWAYRLHKQADSPRT